MLQYTLPRLEEILQKVNGAKIYSVLDFEDAYLQVALDAESQRLTTISMHLGHFAYTKMQFGISATPLIFQEAINSVLRDIPYVCAYQDDNLIGAPKTSTTTLKSQGATHRQQLPIKHAKVSDQSFKGQFPQFPFGKWQTAAKSRASPCVDAIAFAFQKGPIA